MLCTNLVTSCDHIEHLGSQMCVVLPTQYVIYCMCTKSCDVTGNIQVVMVLICLSCTMLTMLWIISILLCDLTSNAGDKHNHTIIGF